MQKIEHLGIAVSDLEKSKALFEKLLGKMQRLKEEGFRLLNEAPKRGADNKLICFVHPKSANGLLVELCQEIK